VNSNRTLWLLWALLLLAPLVAGEAHAASKPVAPKNDECLACHSEPSMTKDDNGKQVSLHVDDAKFKASIHSAFNCVDCHTEIKGAPHDAATTKPQCATCHSDEQSKYDHGLHAKAIKAGDGKAAQCQDCHGSVHELLPSSDPASRVNRHNIPATCGTCHNNKATMQSAGLSTAPFNSYEDSVHGKAVNGGSQTAAVCTDCHGQHDILTARDSNSPIFKFNVPQTCAKCHGNESKQYTASIHGKAIARGVSSAPVCTDCHGIHSIKKPSDPNSSVSAANISNVTCANCHEGVKLTNEFGVPTRRATTYLASYHGMASKMGSAVAANCASCHTAHNILPSSDPASSINHANLAKTCGQCHPGANDNFIKGKVHLDAQMAGSDIGGKIVNFVSKTYIWLIVFTIGGMLLHNLIIFRRKLEMSRKGAAHAMKGSPRILFRMSKLQRIQHFTLLVSFFVLVFTGFALKFPNSFFGVLLGNSEKFRSIVHRIAGVVLIAVGGYHILYAIFTGEGRKLIKDFLPEWKDITDTRDTVFYYLGFIDKKPQFKRFNYAEKMEYWALVWGTIVMASTGVMAWFKVGVGTVVPRWIVDVALTIHFYEAILATLAILVWHFYMVIYDPETYPMNWAWLDGRMSVEHYQHEHPLDTEALAQAPGSEEPAESEEAAQKEEEVVAAHD
jgi:cytochrome b subunit of formate dehydrogenase